MRPNAAETEEFLLNAHECYRNAVDRLMERHRQSLERMAHGRRHRAVARRTATTDLLEELGRSATAGVSI